jgi:hypothetical protein
MADTQPIIVHETTARRLFGLVVFGGCGVLIGAIAALLLLRHDSLAASLFAILFFVPACVFFLGYAAYLCVWRIAISADRITKQYGLWTRTILVAQLRGGRTASERVVLESVTGVKIGIPQDVLARIAAPPSWLTDVVDLDAEEYADSVERLGADQGFGATPQARFESLALYSRLALYLEFCAIGLCLWLVIWPHPYVVALLTTGALTVLAVVLALSGRFRLDPRLGNADVRPSLFYSLMFPAVALAGRAFHDCNLIDVVPLVEWSATAAFVLTAILAIRSASLVRNGWPAALCFVALTAWFAGVLCQADITLDSGRMTKYPVAVLGVRHTDHFDYVQVQAWGPFEDANEIRIPGRLKHELDKGDRVCVYLGQGSLGWRWYALGTC